MQTNDHAASTGEQLSNAPTATERRPDFAAGSTGERPGDDAMDTAQRPTATGETPPGSSAANGARLNDPQSLARLIAEGRRPRSRRFAELEPFRDVLLAERRAGASIRLIAESLGKLGVSVSAETVRVWLLRHKMPKRRRPRRVAAGAKPTSGFAGARPVTATVPSLPLRNPRIARDDL